MYDFLEIILKNHECDMQIIDSICLFIIKNACLVKYDDFCLAEMCAYIYLNLICKRNVLIKFTNVDQASDCFNDIIKACENYKYESEFMNSEKFNEILKCVLEYKDCKLFKPRLCAFKRESSFIGYNNNCELKNRLIDCLKNKKYISGGAFGEVYEINNLFNDGKKYAVKKINIFKVVKPKTSELQSEPKSKLQSEPKSKLQSETKSKLQSETKSKLQSETKSKLQSETKSKLQSESESITAKKHTVKKNIIYNFDENNLQSALFESGVLKHFKHDNIIKTYGTFSIDDSIYMIMEYMPMCLYDFMDQRGSNSVYMQYIIYQLMCGINYIHNAGYVHNDISLENVMIDPDTMKIKIIDFGKVISTTRIVKRENSNIGRMCYRSPELLIDIKDYDHTSYDMWCVGCIMLELINGQDHVKGKNHFWYEINDYTYVEDITQLRYIFGKLNIDLNNVQCKDIVKKCVQLLVPRLKDEQGYDLLYELLQIEPKKRILSQDAIQHPFFDNIYSN
jgi:serine/threonine protein kinase